MKKALKDLIVRRLKPAAQNLDVTDIDELDSKGVLRQGFFLRVTPRGRKLWYGPLVSLSRLALVISR